MPNGAYNIFHEEHGIMCSPAIKDLVESHNIDGKLLLPLSTLWPLKCIGTHLLRTEDSILIEYITDGNKPVNYCEVIYDRNPLWPDQLLLVLQSLSNLCIFELTKMFNQNGQ